MSAVDYSSFVLVVDPVLAGQFYCFVIGRRIVIVHAFVKKTEQSPDKELALARKRAKRRSKVRELKYKTVRHDHKKFLERARARRGFSEAYDALELEYQVADQLLRARARAGLTQDAVAELMGTTKGAISRLEGAGKHAPSLTTLKRYARAVGCKIQVRLVPEK